MAQFIKGITTPIVKLIPANINKFHSSITILANGNKYEKTYPSSHKSSVEISVTLIVVGAMFLYPYLNATLNKTTTINEVDTNITGSTIPLPWIIQTNENVMHTGATAEN